MIDGETGWLCTNDKAYSEKLELVRKIDLLKMSHLCHRKADQFSVAASNKIMETIYLGDD